MSARLGDSDEAGQLTLGGWLRQFGGFSGGFSGGGTGGGASFVRQQGVGAITATGAVPSSRPEERGPRWEPGRARTSIP